MRMQSRSVSLSLLYRMTTLVGVIGTVIFWVWAGWRPGVAFLLGAIVSLGNLWLYQRLASVIAPGANTRKPWQASAFMSRYLIFFAFGYVIVNALGVSPLPVVLGLLASTAGVLVSSITELMSGFFR